MKKQSISQSRKFKYGSVAVLFTAAVIAAIVVLNVVATALTQKFSLYVDMTSEDLYSISEACDTMIEGLMADHENDVVPLHYEILFCAVEFTLCLILADTVFNDTGCFLNNSSSVFGLG